MYLRSRDYDRFIQADNLSQVLSTESSLRLLAESAGQEEIISYLRQKYDVFAEFTDTGQYDHLKTYFSGDRVELNFPAYDASKVYAIRDTAAYGGQQYVNTVAITIPEVFNSAKWKLVGNQYDLFYVPYPYPLFDVYGLYLKNDRVYWKGRIYQGAQGTTVPSHESTLDALNYPIPLQNIFPDDPVQGKGFWATGTLYSFSQLYPTDRATDYSAWSSLTSYTTGQRVAYGNAIWQAITSHINKTPGADITYWEKIAWTPGDNRSQQMVMVMVDVVLYHLHSRIAPRNIPELRINRYNAAIKWLKMASEGDITPNLSMLQPNQGMHIRWGGKTKLENNY